MDDWHLLREYSERGSEAAFTSLVNKYMDLVYSTALRRLANADAAQDVTQSVFCLLARKAGDIRRETALVGWLYQTASFKAAKYWRTEFRRRQREQELAFMQTAEPEPDPLWEQIMPHLDEALNQLDSSDRLALLLRFFQQKPLREIGEVFGVTEDAARMRVNRGIEKLRVALSDKAITCAVPVLAGLLLEKTVRATPESVAKRVAAVALKAANVASVPSLLKSAIAIMTKTKIRTVLLSSLLLLITADVASHFYNQWRQSQARIATAASMTQNPLAGTASLAKQRIRSRPAAAIPQDPAVGRALASLRRILYSPLTDGKYPSKDLSAALDALKPNSDDAVDTLLEALDVGSDETRKRAMSGLGYLGDKATVALPALLELGRSKIGHDQKMALWSAVSINPQPKFAAQLIELYKVDAIESTVVDRKGWKMILRNVDVRIRFAVEEALAMLIHTPTATGPQVCQMVAAYLGDADPDMRLLAASVLTSVWAGDAVPAQDRAKAVNELVACLKVKLSLGIDFMRCEHAIRTLTLYGANSPAEPRESAMAALRAFSSLTTDETMRKIAADGLSLIASTPTVPASLQNEAAGDPALKLEKEVRNGSRTVAELAVSLEDPLRGVPAARALYNLGNSASAALFQLRKALQTDNEVYRELIARVIKQVDPESPKPLLTRDELLPALRAVSEKLDAGLVSTDGSLESDIDHDLKRRFSTHAQILAFADKLGTVDPTLRAAFVSKLLEFDPKLVTILEPKSAKP